MESVSTWISEYYAVICSRIYDSQCRELKKGQA